MISASIIINQKSRYSAGLEVIDKSIRQYIYVLSRAKRNFDRRQYLGGWAAILIDPISRAEVTHYSEWSGRYA